MQRLAYTRVIALSALLGIVVALGIPTVAQATLIGDTVKFQCTNCGPPTDDDFVVVEGSAELTLFNQSEVDVEDSSLRINWIFDSNSIISNINYVWSDLDWVGKDGEIVGVAIDPTSTWGVNPAVSINFGPHSVSTTNNGERNVVNGDFLLLNLDVNHVPEPNTLALAAICLVGMGCRRHQWALAVGLSVTNRLPFVGQ